LAGDLSSESADWATTGFGARFVNGLLALGFFLGAGGTLMGFRLEGRASELAGPKPAPWLADGTSGWAIGWAMG
jgi:hypothetical protein